MVTFRLLFHIGSVECVTCHVPCRKATLGGMKVCVASGDVVGARKVSGVCAMTVVVRLFWRERPMDHEKWEDQVLRDFGNWKTVRSILPRTIKTTQR